jgi:hypothetical protein
MLFASINIPTLDKAKASQEILSLDDSLSWWDKYRHTKMFPLMTKGAKIDGHGIANSNVGELTWVDHAPKVIVDWIENIVFPWIGCKTRVMALVTQPGYMNKEHIDCNLDEVNTRQHKFRIVLQGNTDTLYFKTEQGDVYAPDVHGAFLMDGGWPHGMVNYTNQPKVTLALGAPWAGNDSYKDVTVLMNRANYTMPAIEKYLNTYY